jgi:heme/copper-type cytochrome/quinol oxidase subunit 2
MVLAHAFGQRYELPIPLLLFVLGGAVVVIASFLLVFRQEVGRREQPNAADVTHVQRVRPVWAAVSIVALALLIAAGVVGSQEVPENILPTVFWVLVWVAVPLSCGLLGDWTQTVNPYANLAKLADSPRLRRRLLGSREPVGWPAWLGWWPSAVLYFLAGLAELVFNLAWTVPRTIALALLGYAALCLFCGLIFGRPFLQRGEMFTAAFATWGRLGFFRFGAPGRRGFAGGLDVAFAPTPSRITFVLLLLVSVNFDGLLSTPRWNALERRVQEAIGVGPGGLEVLRTLTFAVLLLVICGLFGAFALAATRAGRHATGFRGALGGLLPSVLPIAFGYLLAHYVQYLLINSQLLFPLVGNPIGKAWWPLHLPFPFNDSYEVHAHLLPASVYWYVAVIVIIAVHVTAVVIAHRHLARTGRTAQRARRSEYPWLVAMVAYTMLSLWLLAQPLTKEKTATPETATAAHTSAVSTAAARWGR